MTETELTRFRDILESRKAELERMLLNRDGIMIEKTADALDEVQHAAERDLAIHNLNRESNLLRNVRLALDRLEAGSFGVCAECEEEISPKRLIAVPWAPFCLQCQEQADRNHNNGDETIREFLVNAA
jgi:DnaK suppressor protein